MENLSMLTNFAYHICQRFISLVWLTPFMHCDGFRFRSYAKLRYIHRDILGKLH